jgi:hypothetical protein
LVVERKIEENQSDFAKTAKVCKNSRKKDLKQFVERLLNNNDPNYFYLHSDPSMGFPDRSCAFLRLPIGLRAYQHYATCLQARLLSLGEIFQAKLGWLTGSLYSQIGTPDWAPDNCTEEDFDEMVEETLASACSWEDDERVDYAKKQYAKDHPGIDFKKAPLDELRRFIKTVEPPSKVDAMLDAVKKALVDIQVKQDDVPRAINRLRDDFKALGVR